MHSILNTFMHVSHFYNNIEVVKFQRQLWNLSYLPFLIVYFKLLFQIVDIEFVHYIVHHWIWSQYLRYPSLSCGLFLMFMCMWTFIQLYNYIKVQYWQDDCERDEDLYELTEQEFKSDLREGNLFIINNTDLDHCYGIPWNRL